MEPTRDQSPGARWVLAAVLALHGGLLAAMLPDYFADNDWGYHVSLARQYGEHGAYFWDHLSWAPTGRPNLQGPLLHASAGLLGRMLGGQGDDYVLAFSVLAVLQWAAAMFTAVYFARRYGGDGAALLAGALLAGSVYSAAPFFVGVPSGWIFILTPWAIHYFLQDRYILSALFTSAVMYVHLGGAPVAPFGVLLAALLTRRWKGLLIAGAVTAVLTAPYTIHFLRHADWYTGRRGHVAGSVATLIYLLAAPGLVWLLRNLRENLFLLIWPVSGLAWLFQDGLRFFLQSTIAAAVIGGMFAWWMMERFTRAKTRATVAAGLVALATLFPLSIPSLPVELAWAVGRGFPRELDWKEARALAGALEQAKLNDRIVTSYYDSLSLAMAAYTPLRHQYGHWGEVRPAQDPARDVSAGSKVYVAAVPPDDGRLREWERRGLVRIHGGSARTSLLTLPAAAPLEQAAALASEALAEEATWLANHGVNNRMPPPRMLLQWELIDDYRRRMDLQRKHAGRMQVVLLVYAYALEATDPEVAAGVRSGARGWGSVANFIGDETAMDYLSEARFEQFRTNLREFAREVLTLSESRLPTGATRATADRLMRDFFTQE